MSNCTNCTSILIALSHIAPGLVLTIDAKKDNTLFDCKEAEQEGEAQYQLVEGCFYDYEFSDPKYIFKTTECIQAHSRKKHIGIIAPNIYVGTLTLEIIHQEIPEVFYKIKLEVQSLKSDYRRDYRYMLESITEKCTDLIMQIDSPINQHFETDFNKNPKTLYQRFSFVKSLIDSLEFEEAIQKIVSSPTTKWEEEHEEKDIRRIRRFNQKNINQLVTKSNRMEINSDHFLNKSYGLSSIPTKIDSTRKTESIDTAENRFIKHALEEFLFFCENCELKFEKYSTAKLESGLLATKLSTLLNQSFFKQISRPTSLKLNSPVLQRKSGYREVLNAWLKFDLAAKLIWKGGDNVYDAGKKDIATLYEYWLFFTLLDLLKEVFEIEPKDISDLIKETPDGLHLQIKQGKFTALRGVYDSDNRKLNIRFNYNRSFSGKQAYPDSGSWTTTLRPDYTLSIWPFGIEDDEAEKQELIVHVHFDAKYKIANLTSILPQSDTNGDFGEISEFEIEGYNWAEISQLLESRNFIRINKKGKSKLISLFWEELDSIDGLTKGQFDELVENVQQAILSDEKKENLKGNYKNADLLKMHAYKDAIRRTGGAYVLYPGDKSTKQKGFHEIIPGLGAFPLKPSKTGSGIGELKAFILEIIEHFINRASQREKTAYRIFDIHQSPPSKENEVREALPEAYGENRNLLPDETFVLVGYVKSEEHKDWIKKNKYYNFRMNLSKGSLFLNKETVNAKFLLLHKAGMDCSGELWKISKGPRVVTKEVMGRLKYPDPSQDNYLVWTIEKIDIQEFANVTWNFKNLTGYPKGRSMARPFVVSLAELMKVKSPTP